MEKETTQKHVHEDIAEFDTLASGKILYQMYHQSLLQEVFVILLSPRTWDSMHQIGGYRQCFQHNSQKNSYKVIVSINQVETAAAFIIYCKRF